MTKDEIAYRVLLLAAKTPLLAVRMGIFGDTWFGFSVALIREPQWLKDAMPEPAPDRFLHAKLGFQVDEDVTEEMVRLRFDDALLSLVDAYDRLTGSESCRDRLMDELGLQTTLDHQETD